MGDSVGAKRDCKVSVDVPKLKNSPKYNHGKEEEQKYDWGKIYWTHYRISKTANTYIALCFVKTIIIIFRIDSNIKKIKVVANAFSPKKFLNDITYFWNLKFNSGELIFKFMSNVNWEICKMLHNRCH